MSLPAWPAAVPHCPLLGTMQIERTVEPPLVSEMNSGTTRRRRKTTLRVAQVSFSLRMTHAQLASFQVFHEDTLGDGAASFTMPILFGPGTTDRNCVFAEPPSYERMGGGLTRVTISLLVEDLRAPQTAEAPANVSVPIIFGQAVQGETLTATTGVWTGFPVPTYTYQWKADGTNIFGATASTFVLTSAQVGAAITVSVTATNTEGTASATSAATAAVTVPAPVNVTLPTITGAASQGSTLTATPGEWMPSSGVTFAYQWKAGGVNISGATGPTFFVTSNQVGTTITVGVTATNASGSTMATSPPTAVVAPLGLYFTDMTPASIAAAGVTATRSGLGWQYDATGKITTCPNNLQLWSQEFDNAAWTKNQVSIDPNVAVAPDGTTTADKLNDNAVAGEHFVRTGSVFPAGGGVFSIYAKQGELSSLNINVFEGGLRGGIFDLAAGTFTVQGGATVSMTDAGNGWWRCSFAYTSAASAIVYVRLPGAYVGAGTGFYIWGAQVERVTHETSPRTYNATTSAAYYGPRLDHDPATLAARGLMNEPAATNAAWHNRDLTNAVWTKTGVTAAKDQAGLDGVANSASKLTATAANGTCLQAITLASSQRTQSAWVKRVTGSGVVEMTTDGGTTWTAITVTGTWTRVRIPAQTVTNPSLGFRLVTSGDAIAVDLVQNETGATMTSEIFTSTAAVTRAAENISFTPPASVSNIRYTFDDNSTQDAAVTGGSAYTVPTNLNRPRIKSIVSV